MMSYVQQQLNEIEQAKEAMTAHTEALCKHLTDLGTINRKEISQIRLFTEQRIQEAFDDIAEFIAAKTKEKTPCSTAEPSASGAESGPADEAQP